MTDHLITPPPELVQQVNQWEEDWHHSKVKHIELELYIAAQAAAWGYDQRGEVNEAQLQQARDEELEACIAWFDKHIPGYELVADKLRAARRPKPQTLSSIALQTLDTIERDAHYLPEITDTIRRAILRLKKLEDSNG